jgi:hypothetical protein
VRSAANGLGDACAGCEGVAGGVCRGLGLRLTVSCGSADNEGLRFGLDRLTELDCEVSAVCGMGLTGLLTMEIPPR